MSSIAPIQLPPPIPGGLNLVKQWTTQGHNVSVYHRDDAFIYDLEKTDTLSRRRFDLPFDARIPMVRKIQFLSTTTPVIKSNGSVAFAQAVHPSEIDPSKILYSEQAAITLANSGT